MTHNILRCEVTLTDASFKLLLDAFPGLAATLASSVVATARSTPVTTAVASTPAASTPANAKVVDEINELFESEFGSAAPIATTPAKKANAVARATAIGPVPVAYPVAAGGGYLTNASLQEHGDAWRAYKASMLSPQEELEIVRAFRGIAGMKFADAAAECQKQSYRLHVLYVGKDDLKMAAKGYSPTVLGVRITDENFDYETQRPSADAVITEVLNVGGL